MGKNIVLCADGTGNKGGYTPDSNVYKVYNAIELHHPHVEQISFYDNGVGTQKAKFIRSLSGALGFGFRDNVCDLYEYLARHYDPGDKIYMFGFSRGAATIRAFNGFVYACGLIDGRGKGNKALKAEVRDAMKTYEKCKSGQSNLCVDKGAHGDLPEIEFIGVWDTVSALGFPERTDVAGIFLWALNWFFYLCGVIADFFFPHKFYNYELTPNVKKACHALAIDDERTSFWPMIWNEGLLEGNEIKNNVEQVWFSGMHSNVGGGYERQGLANVCFNWMLHKIPGLTFRRGLLEAAEADANVNGRIYNSREGFASYYRYHPRDLKSLCDTAGTEVKIHESVMRRMKLRTANYAPRLLPKNFLVVDNGTEIEPCPEVHDSHWELFHAGISGWIWFRKWLYGILLELTLAVVGIAGYFWMCQPDCLPEGVGRSHWITDHIADILEYFTPQYFDALIKMAVRENPLYFIIGIVVFVIYLLVRNFARNRTTVFAEQLRKLFIIAPEGHPQFLNDEESK